MTFRDFCRLAAVLAFCAAATPATAYIGPGLGAGVIATMLGVLGSILLLVVAVFYYPVKRFLKRRKPQAPSSTPADSKKL